MIVCELIDITMCQQEACCLIVATPAAIIHNLQSLCQPTAVDPTTVQEFLLLCHNRLGLGLHASSILHLVQSLLCTMSSYTYSTTVRSSQIGLVGSHCGVSLDACTLELTCWSSSTSGRTAWMALDPHHLDVDVEGHSAPTPLATPR